MSNPLPLQRQLRGCCLLTEGGEGGEQCGRCELAGQGTFLTPQRAGPLLLLLLLHNRSASPLSLAQQESCHQEFSGTFKNCEERNSREEGERKRSVARGRQDKSRSDEEGNIL